MGSIIEMVLTVLALSFWVLFPIGIFLSVSKLDKNTDEVVRLEHLREKALPKAEPGQKRKEPVFEPVPFDWHHPITFFRQWVQHE